jgi:hypothetical protein
VNSYRPSVPHPASGSFSQGNSSDSVLRRDGRSSESSNAQNTFNPSKQSNKPSRPSLQYVDTDPVIVRQGPPSNPARRSYSFQDDSPNAFADSLPYTSSFDTKSDTVDRSHIPEPKPDPYQQQQIYQDFNAPIKYEAPDETLRASAQRSPLDRSAGSSSASSFAPQELFQDSNRQFPASSAFYHSYPSPADLDNSMRASSTSSNPSQAPYGPPGPIPAQKEATGNSQPATNARNSQHSPQNRQVSVSFQPVSQTALPLRQHFVSQAAQEDFADDEDDPFDVTDDADTPMDDPDDYTWEDGFHDGHLKKNDLGIVVALQAEQHTQSVQLRSCTSFIDRPDMLATYIPSPQVSPLNDSMTARIFCHFVNVTGPGISMFERHPANPSLIFQGRPVPVSQQHIWTCKYPSYLRRHTRLENA